MQPNDPNRSRREMYTETRMTSRENRRQEKAAIAILTALIIVMLMLIGLMIYLFVFSGKEKEDKTPAAESVSSAAESSSEAVSDSRENIAESSVEAEYLLADSSTHYIKEEQIEEMSLKDLNLAAYEIYARYGVVFSESDVQKHFEACSWYQKGTTPYEEFRDTKFNGFEKENLALLTMEIRTRTAEDYINAYSDLKNLGQKEMDALSYQELQTAIDEIYARHGLTFENADTQKYFNHLSWYQKLKKKDAVSESELNTYELANLRSMQDKLQTFIEKDMILKNSASRTYSESELGSFSDSQLRYARNEIYARHGYQFSDAELYAYFRQYDWYKPQYTDVRDCGLNATERSNIAVIQSVENLRESRTAAAEKAAAEAKAAEKAAAEKAAAEKKHSDSADHTDGDYILPGADCHLISNADLDQLTRKEVWLAKNEFYARHGFIFTNETLIAYFGSKSWYHGTTAISSAAYHESEYFNDTEYKNWETVLRYQKAKGWRDDSF